MNAKHMDTIPPCLWRDLTDPRLAREKDDLEAGLKEPEFDNLVIPEHFGPVKERIDAHKLKRYAFELDEYAPWMAMDSLPEGQPVYAQAGLLVNDLLQLFTLNYRASHVIGLHTEEQIWFDNPLSINEVVTLEGEYVDAYVQRGQGTVVMEAKATDSKGNSIIRHRGIEIMKTIPGNITGRAQATPEKRVTGETDPEARRMAICAEDVRVGDVILPMEKTITAEQAAVFSRVGEFVTNIHDDLATARKGNLRLPIVQGAQLFCAITHMLTRFFGPSFLSGGWLRTKFIAPVEVFEPISLSGQVTGVEDLEDGRKKVMLEIWARRSSDNRLAVAGWASCVK